VEACVALPSFKSSPKKALGLHIGASQIRAVEIERTKGELRLLSLGWIETPSDAFIGNRMENPSIVASAISRLLNSRNIRTKRVLSTVDANDTIARTIVLPSMAKKDLRKAIIFETEASLPSTGEDNILDYEILRVFQSPEDNSEQVEVLILSAQRQHVVSIAEAMVQADLKPIAVDLTPVAAFRAEKRSDTYMEKGEDLILITINDRCTDLTIIHQGNVRLVRSLPVGSNSLLDALGEKPLFDDRTDAMKQGQEEAPKEQEEQSEVPPEEQPLQSWDPFGGGQPTSPFGKPSSSGFGEMHDKGGFSRLENMITDLADETLNTIRYGQSFGKEQSEVRYAIIDGYFPYKESFIGSLKERLGIDVFAGNPFTSMDLSSPGLDADLVNRFAYNFSTACGLALRGVGEHE
jgi:type IV pilus assembly protein PilM